MKILVLGASGMLGKKMMSVLGEGHSVIGASRRSDAASVIADITRLDDLRSLVRRVMPQVIVNCAAYTAVDDCETHADQAFMVNAIGAKNVAIAALETNCDVFHFSSDYVFDGKKEGGYTEYDAPAPMSVYGGSKLAGEIAVRETAARWYVARIQWLYGEGGKNFADSMLRLSDERPSLSVVDDQFGAPTYTGDVARQTKALIEARAYGLYHMSAGGTTTWYRFAREVLDRAGRQAYPIKAITTAEYPTPAHRPAWSKLRNMNLELTVGDAMRPWTEGLDEFMQRRIAPAKAPE